MIQEKNELLVIIDQSGVEQQTSQTLKEKFLPFFEQAERWKRKAEAIVVTDASQKHEMQIARQARLALREIRINADKTRKALKEDSLRYGRAVQGVYNVIEFLVKPIEDHLENQERFVEIQEAERVATLKAKREIEIAPYADFAPPAFLGLMSEDDYQKHLNGAKNLFQQKIEAEQKAEAERIERERKEAEERERIRAENEKLRAEAEAREKQMQAERAKAEAAKKEADKKIQAEREARQKVEAEAMAKAEAAKKEIEAEKARAEAEEKARQSAPDKAKLAALAEAVDAIEIPSVSSEEAKKIIEDTKTLLAKVSARIRLMAQNI